MTINRLRRLPGFRFEVQTPPPGDVLPRMDIAVFVGFASAGPLHMPVAVEDEAHFQEVFGDDLPLAWDTQRGEQLRAHLGPAVRAFFRNGGRRCWIVRVAGHASESSKVDRPEIDFFPIPGLLELNGDELRPAFARARSPGAWFDSFRVGTALSTESIIAETADTGLAWLDVILASPDDLQTGDLLRLRFSDENLLAFVLIGSISVPPKSLMESRRNLYRLDSSTVLFFRHSESPLPVGDGSATIFTHAGCRKVFARTVQPADTESPPSSLLQTPLVARPTPAALDLAVPLAEAPEPGMLLRVDLGTDQLWLIVGQIGTGEIVGSPPAKALRVFGETWRLDRAPDILPPLRLAERLNLELSVRRENEFAARLDGLGFAQTHPRFWNGLPTDADLYTEPDFISSLIRAKADAHEAVWNAAITPRFELAGGATDAKLFLPLGMATLPKFFLGAEHSARTPLERDALDRFAPELFLDHGMIEPTTPSLLAQADFIRYQSSSPRRLLGIHAAMEVEEATLIAVPDAIHPGWEPATVAVGGSPPESLPLDRPQWWHFKECWPKREIPRAAQPEWGNFLPCDLLVLAPPSLQLVEPPDQIGTFGLAWLFLPCREEPDKVQFLLEESALPSFEEAATIYSGNENRITVYGRSPGDYYYRVRAVVSGESSDWSNGVEVGIRQSKVWMVSEPGPAEVASALAVQRALLRMCGARGDLFAVLALPEHFREEEAINYVSQLKSPNAPGLTVHDELLQPINITEKNILSYGASYHPWPIERDPAGDFRRVPPDGAACGVLARRALSRGAWIAPANEALSGAVALTPPIDRRRWLDLQEARVNLFRHEPGGFLALDADTLIDDEDLRPINVRRLLILLRRLATREGATYVFEPNDDSFRRLVEHRFEELLNRLYVRGAFAGQTSSEAFEVNTGVDLNPPQSVEQGRFIIELKVAPSLPLTFLTIRLMQMGDRMSVVELR
jgi:Phage tail sheath protein subtilisin-like domain